MNTVSSRKVSARFSADAARKLHELEQIWKVGTSEALARAVTEAAQRLEEAREDKPDAYDLLMAGGLIGSIKDGRSDASVTYKNDIAQYIDAKHGHR